MFPGLTVPLKTTEDLSPKGANYTSQGKALGTGLTWIEALMGRSNLLWEIYLRRGSPLQGWTHARTMTQGGTVFALGWYEPGLWPSQATVTKAVN